MNSSFIEEKRVNGSAIFSAESISKSFRGKEIIKNFSYLFNVGVYGIAGPNGSGKSTFLSLAAGILPLDSGRLTLNNMSVTASDHRAKTMLSFAPRQDMLYPFMSGAELLDLVSRIRGIEEERQKDSLIENFSVQNYLDSPFHEMSEGTRQKFSLISALLGKADLLIFDEPTNGLDKDSALYFGNEILSRKDDCIVLLSTHDSRFLDTVGGVELKTSMFHSTDDVTRENNPQSRP
jgi:ABC-type multidrug transport system ATPase subunit